LGRAHRASQRGPCSLRPRAISRSLRPPPAAGSSGSRSEQRAFTSCARRERDPSFTGSFARRLYFRSGPLGEAADSFRAHISPAPTDLGRSGAKTTCSRHSPRARAGTKTSRP
jgi:hypothetical protein